MARKYFFCKRRRRLALAKRNTANAVGWIRSFDWENDVNDGLSISQRDGMFASFDGTQLSYTIYGEGSPVVLLHGFIVDSKINWGGLIDAFVSTGRQIITLDARGHGRSEKPHDPQAYAHRAMARDVSALIDHCGFAAVDVIGCSQGGYTAIECALRDERIGRLALNGVGIEHVTAAENRACAEGMREENPSHASFYRAMADELGADRFALAAWFLGATYPQVIAADLQKLKIPVLVVNGEDDFHDVHEFVSHLANCTARIVPGDHISCLRTLELKAELIAFLLAE